MDAVYGGAQVGKLTCVMREITVNSGTISASAAVKRPAYDTDQFCICLHRLGFICIEGDTESRNGTTG
jgi:hypothetical protein